MKLVTPAEAARILDVDPQTVRGLIDVGRLTPVSLDGEERLRFDEVLSLLRPAGRAT